MNLVINFSHGFLAPIYGARRIILDSELRALSVLPLLTALVVGSFFTTLGLFQMGSAVATVGQLLIGLLTLDPSGIAAQIVPFVLWPAGLLLLGAGVYIGIRLVAAPFYTFLAEKTLVRLGARSETTFELRSLHRWLLLSLRMFLVSMAKAVLFVIAGGILFILSFVPILNVVATFGFLHMLAFDISDFSFEAMEWPLSRRISHVRSNFVTYSGLACGLGLAMIVPGLNLLILPAAVVGASETLHRTLCIPKESK